MLENKNYREKRIEKYEQLGYLEKLSIGEHLRLWAEKYSDRVALVEDYNRLTYGELDIKVDELVAGFYNIGVKRGQNVVVQLPNNISFVITCFALFRIGAVPVLALPANREAELNEIFSMVNPIAYIIPDKFLGFNYREMAEKLSKNHPSLQHIIVDGENVNGISLKDVACAPIELEAPSYRETAFLLLSGGTTGTPKLIPRTHTDYIYNAKSAAARCKLNAESVYLAVLPVAHNFPLGNPGIIGTMSAGGKVVICKTLSCDEAFPLIEREKVTITSLVPAMVNLWLEVLEWDTSYDISSLQVLQVGGAMLDENLAKRIIAEMNCKLQQVYGIAEGLICCTSLDDPEDIIYSCQGRPLSDSDEIRIVDQNGNDVKRGEYGELLVRGPYTISGYYKADKQNLKTFTEEEYYCSGDKARITAEGNIQIGGRIKEQINRAGEKIMPAEIESYLCLHPDIKEAAVVGITDVGLGERNCAYLMTDNRDLNILNIQQFLNSMGVARYKIPDQIEFIDFWPLTNVGKINKQKLKELAAASKREDDCEFSYLEEKIDFNGDANFIAAQIVDLNIFENYTLYENRNEISLGMGIHALISVDSEYTTLKINNNKMQFENDILSETLDKAFSSVLVKNWRAYGIVNFELARYNHKLPLISKGENLLKLFIPKVEVRFLNNSILLRALERKELDNLCTAVINILADNSSKGYENTLIKRVYADKLEVPEIYSYESDIYMGMVANAVKEIRERKYQKVILSRKIPLNQELDMVASYISGRKVNSPSRAFILNIDGLSAVGFSPETVVEVDSQGWVSTLPLAGTRATGTSDEEENRLKEELLNDPKEIAEHAVSVKLAFEEMRSICDPETIGVSDFMSVFKRGTVQHIASRLKGKLKASYNSWHAFNTLFPAVTASGIPKKESIEAIGRFEAHPRNLYSGCVMTFDSNGTMDAALVLRTIFQKEGTAWLHVGAGIVEMSKPSRELEETCEKVSSVSKQLVSTVPQNKLYEDCI